jgi:3,4-dihydroxy 2-butanone 4-phosphate synthase/GTP cyclohydrolase II
MQAIPELLKELQDGRMIILVDDEGRENEGDLVLAASKVEPFHINFMAKEARGLICLSLSEDHVRRLELPLMVSEELNQTNSKTAFTVSIEAREGITTGISAYDRAKTILVASNPNAKRSDLCVPGHIFPLIAKKGGVLKRAGHTEGSIDLTRMAGLGEAAVICEVMNDDGTMARLDDLKAFAKKHDLKIGSIEDLIKYRKENGE